LVNLDFQNLASLPCSEAPLTLPLPMKADPAINVPTAYLATPLADRPAARARLHRAVSHAAQELKPDIRYGMIAG